MDIVGLMLMAIGVIIAALAIFLNIRHRRKVADKHRDRLQQDIRTPAVLASRGATGGHNTAHAPYAPVAMEPNPGSQPLRNSSAVSSAGEKFIILNILSKASRGFSGSEILLAMEALNLHYGTRGIFHYYSDEEEKTSLFSLSNGMEPGSFPLKNMPLFSTPVLTMFMRLSDGQQHTASFDIMLDVAQRLCERLGGRLCDARRKPLTSKAVEKIRLDLLSLPQAQTPSEA